mmetsp:Transcript_70858/g.148238  ORF Transcript_70858/g.148238 Transcript_70858/m.148238 type:complete len:239 (+) Transcript_70858:607-1323(+)
MMPMEDRMLLRLPATDSRSDSWTVFRFSHHSVLSTLRSSASWSSSSPEQRSHLSQPSSALQISFSSAPFLLVFAGAWIHTRLALLSSAALSSPRSTISATAAKAPESSIASANCVPACGIGCPPAPARVPPPVADPDGAEESLPGGTNPPRLPPPCPPRIGRFSSSAGKGTPPGSPVAFAPGEGVALALALLRAGGVLALPPGDGADFGEGEDRGETGRRGALLGDVPAPRGEGSLSP